MSHISRVTRSARIIHAAYMRGATTRRICTRPRGAWKWQDAYAVTTYTIRRTRDLHYAWACYARGPKRSLPQLRQANGAYPCKFGNLHNRPARAGDLA